MRAWCPTDAVGYLVSLAEMGEMSTASRYFVRGFLSGNEVGPPVDNVWPSIAAVPLFTIPVRRLVDVARGRLESSGGQVLRMVGASRGPKVGVRACVRKRLAATIAVLIGFLGGATSAAAAGPTGATVTRPSADTGSDPTATFIHPVQDDEQLDPTVPFTWTAAPGAEAYAFALGTYLYRNDLVDSGILPPTQLSYPVPPLPVGQTLFATILTEHGGAWTYQSIFFRADGGTLGYPMAGGIIYDTTFLWSTVPAAQGHILTVGTTPFGSDLSNSGVLPSTQTSFTVPPLARARVYYATLLTEIAGQWTRYHSVQFATAPITAVFGYPLAHQVVTDLQRPFLWSAPIVGAQAYVLTIGTKRFGTDLLRTGLLTPDQYLYRVPKTLPTGRTLYASILTEFDGAWTSNTVAFSVAPH